MTKLEHDDRLKYVLKRLEDNGVEFNKDKCQFGVNRLKFLGHIFSEQGMSIDEDKVRALMQMPAPQNVAEL